MPFVGLNRGGQHTDSLTTKCQIYTTYQVANKRGGKILTCDLKVIVVLYHIAKPTLLKVWKMIEGSQMYLNGIMQ